MKHFRLIERILRREVYGWISNENERVDGTYGSLLRHARAWLHFGNTCWGMEWSIPSHFCHIGIEFAGFSDHDVCVKFATPLFAFWLHVENLISWDWKRRIARDHWFNQGRELEVAIHNQGIWFKLWTAEDDTYGKRSQWRNFVIYPLDILLGKVQYSCQKLKTETVEIPMPEGTYPATVTMECAKWKRPRWPIAQVRLGADVDIPKGVPIPGKGENSWDCDDDAIFGMSCAARNPEEAVAKVVESALRTRKRYGGSHVMR